MKQNLMESQYEQLAREKFCSIMNEIPFVSDVEIIPVRSQKEYGDFRAIVHLVDLELPRCFRIEVKSNGEKRFARMFMQMTARYACEDCYVFMAPYISEESARAMRDGKCCYMDLSGNCYIVTPEIFLHVSGQSNKYIIKREKKNYLSKSSGAVSAVIRTMLNAPQRRWQVKELARESGKAMGTVSNVKSFLRDRDWIREERSGFMLQNIKELLYAWARDYHKKDALSCEFYSFDAVAGLEHEIARWSASHDAGAVLGGFSAAARYAPTVRYKRVDVYVESQFLDEFVRDLDLQSVSSGGNVLITIPHDETPCMFHRVIDGALVTSPAQTVIDLLGNAARGEEAADAIMTKEYYEDSNDQR